MERRDFLKGLAATGMLAGASARANASLSDINPRLTKISAFDYDGVRLHDSRWNDQYLHAREFYFNVSNDDILQGFRAKAGLPAPGKPLGGWCDEDSSTVFGQWLSGMSRMSRATGDHAMRDKAAYLLAEFSKTVGADGNCRMNVYPYEKLVCGLVDMHQYAEESRAMPLLETVTAYASKTFDRTRQPAAPKPWEMHSGKPLEWYTQPENLFRAYQLTGNKQFKDFAEVWLYHSYWDKFANTSSPPDATGVHAYSHVNSFSSASMRYAITGDPAHLRVVENAYDFLQNTQCYATGGYGPVERIMPPGSLGRALDYQLNSFETPCGSWAGFKMSRYLIEFTGKARYGDWAERLLYNGIGSALQIHGNGRHFYYADYRVGGGVKIFSSNAYTCCSGTYIQDVADFHNLIYYRDDASLYVNLYVPSEVTWKRGDGVVKLEQDTRYPELETSTLTLQMNRSMKFPLRMRIPEWAQGASVKVNGMPYQTACQPGNWATVDRSWNSGDKVEITIPLRMRWQAVDAQHPHRAAVVRGPVVLVQDGMIHEPIFRLPENNDDLNKYLVADNEEGPGVFRFAPPDGANVMAKFRPFYSVGGDYYYRMYFDLDKLPVVLWQ